MYQNGYWIDDGISGTRFDRPGFMSTIAEVQASHVHTICVKDMCRLGRNYLKVGKIMESLRKKGVRLIALNDNVDSANGDDDFTPFRNIMNKWYIRDTSKRCKGGCTSLGWLSSLTEGHSAKRKNSFQKKSNPLARSWML